MTGAIHALPPGDFDEGVVSVASPMPLAMLATDVAEPVFHPFVERYYRRLPQAYRIMDARQEWTLKRWLAGMLAPCCEMDDVLTELWGARPVGPRRLTPSPTGMSAAELQAWLDARQDRPSALGHPYTARLSWLPWLAQMVGVQLPPGASETEQRDAVRYATSGWHAGNAASMSAAARSALTGSRYSRVVPHWRPDILETGIAPTMWDVTVMTRTSETPYPEAVLRAIEIKGCKPAGVVLHHRAYEAPWAVIEALRPTWADWERTRRLRTEPEGAYPTVRPVEPWGAKIKDLTGPGLTDGYGVGGTDLGVVATAPDGRLVAVLGDTFEQAGVGGPGWRSPVVLFADPDSVADGLTWIGAAGEGDYAAQIIDYTHGETFNGYTVSTILPTDIITLGNTMYLHVAAMNPFPTVQYTAVYRSTDSGETWSAVPGMQWPGNNRGGLFQMVTWARGDDGHVYMMSTGFQRDKGIILLRAPEATFTDVGTWQDWRFVSGSWRWVSTPPSSPSVILPGQFGELCLRRVGTGWVLSAFDAGQYRIDVRLLDGPTANMYEAPVKTVLVGTPWEDENHDTGRVAQLYGGYVIPGSTLADMHLVVSQWNTATNWPYKSMQFRANISGFEELPPPPATPGQDDTPFGVTTWTELEETGLTYADVPGQLFANASFEAGIAEWLATGGSLEPISGGVDGFGAARLTSLGAVSAAYDRVNLFPDSSFEAGISHATLGIVRMGVTAQPVVRDSNVACPDGSFYGYINVTPNSTSSTQVWDASVDFAPVPVTGGQTYRFQVAVNCSGGERGWAHVGLQWLDDDGVVLVEGGEVAGTTAPNQQLGPSTLWSWVGISAQAPAAATQVRMILYVVNTDVGTTRTFRFDTVLIEDADTFDGAWFADTQHVPASTPGIDLTQEPKRATYHEDYRVALNVNPINRSFVLRMAAIFRDVSDAIVDQQMVHLGRYVPSDLGWRRTTTAHFRTNEFARTVQVILQFRELINGQQIDIDATEMRAFTGGE